MSSVPCRTAALRVFCHSRYSTLDLAMIVDVRLSISQDVIWNGSNTSSHSIRRVLGAISRKTSR